MLQCYATRQTKNTISIKLINQTDYPAWLSKQTSTVKQWIGSNQFKGDSGTTLVIPDNTGKIHFVLCCVADNKNLWSVGSLPTLLPEGTYNFDVSDTDYQRYGIAWGLGSYQFDRYKKPTRKPAQLFLPNSISPDYINNIVESIYLVRDLINTPTDDLGPSELAKAASQLCKDFNAKFQQIVGNHLLTENYPAIYTVGRASDDAPRLLDIRWGKKKHPKVTLVGKGVCFDSGGLDIKPSSAMLLMKKDMAGAAHVLGLGRMIMAAELPIQLRILIPAVENVISGNAYRPGDIIKMRKGLTVEVLNTDAEGRLVLADALTEAASEKPDMIIDLSTLTGAARVALGTELPGFFTNQDSIAHDIIQHGHQEYDPVWRLPLFMDYMDQLKSSIADLNNSPLEPYGGAIMAALFLKQFVPDDIPWVHFDMMAWNLKPKPGRPQGGEAMALRALFSFLLNKYS